MKKVIKFGAEWCGPCRAYAPVFDKIASEREDWTFEKIDVDKDPVMSEKYSVRSIPLTVFEVDGEIVDTHVGLLNGPGLTKMLDKYQ